MSEHLHRAAELYAHHLAEIDRCAAELYRQQQAKEAHASIVATPTPPAALTASTDDKE